MNTIYEIKNSTGGRNSRRGDEKFLQNQEAEDEKKYNLKMINNLNKKPTGEKASHRGDGKSLPKQKSDVASFRSIPLPKDAGLDIPPSEYYSKLSYLERRVLRAQRSGSPSDVTSAQSALLSLRRYHVKDGRVVSRFYKHNKNVQPPLPAEPVVKLSFGEKPVRYTFPCGRFTMLIPRILKRIEMKEVPPPECECGCNQWETIIFKKVDPDEHLDLSPTIGLKLHPFYTQSGYDNSNYGYEVLLTPQVTEALKTYFDMPAFSEIARFTMPIVTLRSDGGFRIKFLSKTGSRLPCEVYQAAKLSTEKRLLYDLLTCSYTMTSKEFLRYIDSKKTVHSKGIAPVQRVKLDKKSKRDTYSSRRVAKEYAWHYQSGCFMRVLLWPQLLEQIRNFRFKCKVRCCSIDAVCDPKSEGEFHQQAVARLPYAKEHLFAIQCHRFPISHRLAAPFFKMCADGIKLELDNDPYPKTYKQRMVFALECSLIANAYMLYNQGVTLTDLPNHPTIKTIKQAQSNMNNFPITPSSLTFLISQAKFETKKLLPKLQFYKQAGFEHPIHNMPSPMPRTPHGQRVTFQGLYDSYMDTQFDRGLTGEKIAKYTLAMYERVCTLVSRIKWIIFVMTNTNVDKFSSSVQLCTALTDFLRHFIGFDSIVDMACGLYSFAQGSFNLIPGWSEQSNAPGDSKLGVWDLIYFVISIPFMPFTCDWDSKYSYYLTLRKRYAAMTAPGGDLQFIKAIADFIKWLFQKGRACFEDMSLAPLFESQEFWTDWILEAREIIRIEYAVGTSIDAREYSDRLDKQMEVGERMIKALRGMDDKQGLANLLSVYEQLAEISSKEEIRRASRAARSPPFYISLVGPPKTGKSAIVDELCVVGYEAMGKKFDSSLRFNRASTDKFDSGLNNSHRVFVFDDFGAVNSKTGGEATLAQIHLFMGLANDQVAASHQADLKDKGRIFPQADLVIVTTNIDDFGIRDYMPCPAAFFRRLRYQVVLSVKPEFRDDPNNNVLSVTKIFEAHKKYPGYRDFHLFTVGEYYLESHHGEVNISNSHLNDPSLNVNVKTRPILQLASGEEFFDWYRNTVASHFKETELMRGHAEKLINEPLCSLHGIRVGRCTKCAEACFKKQGGIISRTKTYVSETIQSASTQATDKALKYFSGAIFNTLIKCRDDFTLYGKHLWEEYRIRLSDPEFRSYIIQYFAHIAIATVVNIPPTLVDKDTIKVEVKNVDEFSKQFVVTDHASYEKTIQEVSKCEPADVYALKSSESPVVLTPQASSLPLKDLVSKIKRNQGNATVGDRTVCVTGIFDDYVLTVAHIFDKDFSVTMRFDTSIFTISLTAADFVRFDRSEDIAVFRVKQRSFKDLRPWIPVDYCRVPIVTGCAFVHEFYGHSDLVGTPTKYAGESKFSVSIGLPDGSCGGLLVAPFGKGAAVVGMQQLGNKNPLDPTSLMAVISAHVLFPDYETSCRRLFKEPILKLESNGLMLVPNRPLLPHHHKSYVNFKWEPFPWDFKPIADINYGCIDNQTRLVPTPLHGLIPPCTKVPPDFFIGTKPDGEYVNPYNTVVDLFCSKRAVYPDSLNYIAPLLENHFVRLLKDLPMAYPLSEHQSLNGIDGVRFVDAFKLNTGQGLPKRGPKSEWIMGEVGNRQYVSKARASVQWMAGEMAAFVNPGIVADITLKDELKKPDKRIRGFAALPFVYNDIMRRLTLPVMKLIQENALYFGIAIGTDADSYAWRHIYEKHKSRKYHNLYDFSNFDVSHSADLLAHSHKVLMSMMNYTFPKNAKICGYPWHVVASTGFAIVSNMVYNVRNTIYQSRGGLASGLWHTALVNSIAQILIMMMFWHEFTKVHPEYGNGDTFFKYNSIDAYGDDGLMSTDAEGFHLGFFQSVAVQWNVNITDAFKFERFKLSYSVSEWSFLKRSFVVCPRRKWVKAPLELQSTLKALNYWELPTDTSLVDALIERINQTSLYLSVWESSEADAIYEAVVEAFASLWPDQVHQLWTLDYCRTIKFARMNDPPKYPFLNICSREGIHPVACERKRCRGVIPSTLTPQLARPAEEPKIISDALVNEDAQNAWFEQNNIIVYVGPASSRRETTRK
jgi:hypothetical protein